MRAASTRAVLLAALMGTASAHAATLIPVPQVPGSTATYIANISDHDVIAGEYRMPDGSLHAFIGTPGFPYVTFDFDETNYPGTAARGLNGRGNITGTANLDNATSVSDIVQFERAPNGILRRITSGGTPAAGLAGGVNSRRVFVVENWNTDGSVSGFFGKKNRTTEQIDLGFSAIQVRPRDVNNSGDVVGYAKIDDASGYQGFFLHGGVTTLVNYPDERATQTMLEGVNVKGVATGFWEDADFNEFAFVYDTDAAEFRPITVPGFAQSAAGGVNDDGLVAIQAYSQDLTQTAPYIYCPKMPSKCPFGGFEIADPKPVAMLPGFTPHAVPDPAALTPLMARRLMRQ